MENLMKEALVDVTPASDKICLMMPQKSAGNTNKKKLNTDKITKGRGHIANMSDEQTVCAAALECLGVLLMDQGVLMKPVLFFLMQEKITSIAFKTFSRTQLDGDLYRDPICRTNLADLIGFMMQYPVNKMPVPINYGINILTKVKEYDPSQKVRATAAKNLSQAEMTIHNKKDVFYFPVEYKDLKDTLMFNKQTIQKFVEANAQKEVNGSNQSNVIEIEDEAMEQSENIVISDNESEKQVAEKADEELNPPPADEINEISDESEPEKESEVMAPTHEISDDEQVENVEEPEKLVIVDKLPEPVKTAAISSPRKSARNAKRSSPPAPVKTSPKKQKKSGKDDEELVNEMLADFNE